VGLFEFLMVLISVVVGLGLTEILSGAAGLLRVRESVRFHWIHVLFQFGIFFALLQQWWESWDLASVQVISFGAVFFMLLPPICLYLIAHLLYPSPSAEADLEAYYYRQAPLLWGLVVLGTVSGTFILPVLEGNPILHPANLSGIPMIAICLALIVSRSRKVHAVLTPGVLAMVILDTLLANPAISAP
jgi:multisubunit Na+/H+ antiporter MnhG subunit